MQALEAGDPRRIGDYLVLARLGAGGMGQVYLARSAGARMVALKVIRPDLAGNETFRLRFRQEARSAAAVSGAFTSAVLDADPDGTPAWLATSYVPGPSLSDAVHEFGVLGEEGLRVLGIALAEALVAIHAANLIHRDLKPGNVLIASDGPKVIDFGISRTVEGDGLTQAGWLGTPAYMSPEQAARSEELSRASDVFSLGGVLVYAATGHPPFKSGPTPVVLYRIGHQEPELDEIPDRLRPIVEACMAKDPADRPDPQELLHRLTAYGPPSPPEAWMPPGLRADLVRRERELIAYRDIEEPVGATPGGLGRRQVLGVAAAGVAGLCVVGGGTAWALRSAAAPRPVRTPTPPPSIEPHQGPNPLWLFNRPRVLGENLAFVYPPMVLAGPTLVVASDALWGIDVATGRQKWSYQSPNKGGSFDSGGVPLLASGLIYSGNTDHHLYGLDPATGAVKTDIDLTKDIRPPQIAAVDQQHACVVGLRNNVQGVGLLDLSKRALLWWHPLALNGSLPVVLNGSGCYVRSDTSLVALDLRSGRALWQRPMQVTHPVHPARRYDIVEVSGTLVTRDATAVTGYATDGRKLWSKPVHDQYGRLAASGPNVIAIDGDTMYALDGASGTVRWQVKGPTNLNPVDDVNWLGTPVSDGHLVVSNIDQPPSTGFIVVDAATGTVRWTFQATGSSTTHWWAIPGPGHVYSYDLTRLYAFQA